MSKVFSIGNLVVMIGFARSGAWSKTSDEERRIFLFSVNIIKKNNNTGYELIIGPFLLVAGLAR